MTFPAQMLAPPEESETGFPPDTPDEEDVELADVLPERDDPDAAIYRLDLDDSEKRSIEQLFFDALGDYEKSRSDRLSMSTQLRRAHRMARSGVVEDDSEGSGQESAKSWLADTQATDTRRVCDSHATRLNGALLSHSPRFVAEPEDQQAVEDAPWQEEGMDAALTRDGFDEVARQTHDEMVQVSCPLVKVAWVIRTRKVPEDTSKYHPEQHQMMLAAGVPPILAHAASHDLDRKGRIKKKRGWKTVTVKDGNEFTVIPYEDAIIIPADARREEDLWALGEYTSLRGYEMQRLADQGTFYEEAVKEVLSSPPGEGTDQTDADRQEKLELSGVSAGSFSSTFDEDYRHSAYKVVEVAFLGDLDDDGEEEWYLLTFAKDRQRLLRAQYSSYEHGRSWYVPFPYQKHATEIHGESVAELVALPQEAQTHAVNSHLNLTRLLSQAPFTGTYDPARVGPDFDPDKFVLVLGQVLGIPPDAIKWMELPQGLPAALAGNLQFMQWTKDTIDLLTASSNVVSGKEAAGDQTLGEIKAILANAAQVFEDRAIGVMLQWSKVIELCASNLAQFAENGEVPFTKPAAGGATDPATGQPVATIAGQQMPAPGGVFIGSIPISRFASKVKWKPAGMGVFADAQSRLQRSVTLINMTLQDPLWQANPEARLALWDHALQDFRVGDREKLIAMLDQGIKQQQAQQQMAQELALAQAGQQAQMQQSDQLRAEQQHQQSLQQGQQGMAAEQQRMQQGDVEAQRAADTHGLAMAQGLQALNAPPEPNGGKK
jgi:hypothetical protein